jgi:hypothetical protein
LQRPHQQYLNRSFPPVTVAFIIFKSQLAELDAQASLQQRGVASSFLRSNILQLVARGKRRSWVPV